MDRLRVCIVFFAFAVIAARAEETNTPAPASAASNAAPSGVSSNIASGSITTSYAELDYKKLSATKRDQPEAVTTSEGIVKPVQFGTFEIPKGATLKLIAINPDGTLDVDYNGQKYSIPAAKTDLEKRVAEIRGRRIVLDGIEYEDVRWGAVTPTTVSIVHRTGAATIPLEKLPPELQKRFGYDPQKAADWQKAATDRANAEKQRAEVMAKSRVKWGAIIQVVPEGLPMQTHSFMETTKTQLVPDGRGGQTYYSTPGPAQRVDGPVILVVGHPKKGRVAEGESLSFYGYQDGTWLYNSADGTQHTVQRWVYARDLEPGERP